MPPGRAIAAGPEVKVPPSEDQPDQDEPSQVRVHSALSRPRMNTRMSPEPCVATAGSSSTTAADAGAGDATAHASSSSRTISLPVTVNDVSGGSAGAGRIDERSP